MQSVEISRFQRLLEIWRTETINSLARLAEAGPEPGKEKKIKAASSNETLHQKTSERESMARLIEAALSRIDQGTFGNCIACGSRIARGRLDALPWTQYCLRCESGVTGKPLNQPTRGSALSKEAI